ncbi:MAG: AMP-binding protein [Bacteroidota bacterium]
MNNLNLVKTPLDIFLYWEQNTPDRLFLRQPLQGVWKTWSYKKAGDEIRRIAAALKSYGLQPQSNVAILSKNCAHWIMADLAIWMAGHVSVPIYPTLSAASIQQILEHSETKVLFVGKLDNFDQQKSGIPASVKCISFTTYGQEIGDSWEGLIQQHQPVKEKVLRDPEELATIKYTSGTTGKPKGVMITFHALHLITTQALKGFRIPAEGQHFFSYLPLSHIAERMLIEMGALYSGAAISFSESLEKFPQNLMDTQPTIFLAVPRIWSKFQEKILEKMPKLDLLLKIPVVRGVIKKAIRKKLGVSKANWIFTGAAPISKELLEWFAKLDIIIHEVLGMTENLAYSHINLDRIKFGTVGQAWPDVEARISDEGELQMKHGGLMKGYYKEHQLTMETFTPDGFLRTGDKGEVDSEGFLTITGRLKDQFKTDKAKFIDPAPIELRFSTNPQIEQVCVVGMGIPQPIALIVLSAAAKNKTREQIDENISQTMNDINPQLETYERIKTAVIMREDWTIENGLMTPSMKVKRNEIEKIHMARYSKWYDQDDAVVWE